jgi:hypothetical protein
MGDDVVGAVAQPVGRRVGVGIRDGNDERDAVGDGRDPRRRRRVAVEDDDVVAFAGREAGERLAPAGDGLDRHRWRLADRGGDGEDPERRVAHRRDRCSLGIPRILGIGSGARAFAARTAENKSSPRGLPLRTARRTRRRRTAVTRCP